MSEIDSASKSINKFLGSDAGSLAKNIGVDAARAALHMTFPNDIEYYMMALELTDYAGNTIDYFVFPIMPSSYKKDEPSATTVQKTMSGVSSVGNSSFVPIPIMIAGNFGRKLKILVSQAPAATVAHYSTTTGIFNRNGIDSQFRGKFKKAVMNTRVKTGFGAMKILESICSKAQADVDGKPNQLYMYNPAFNDNYLVKVMNFSPRMNMHSNMIHEYELSLTAIAPIEVTVRGNSRNTLVNTMSRSIVQKAANEVVKSIRKLL